MSRMFDGVTITTHKGEDQSVEEFLTDENAKEVERELVTEQVLHKKSFYRKPRGRYRIINEKSAPGKHLRRDGGPMGKEPVIRVVIRAIFNSPDRWMTSTQYYDEKIHSDIKRYTFTNQFGHISNLLMVEGQMASRENRQGGMGLKWEYKFAPTADWMELICNDFEAAVNKLHRKANKFIAANRARRTKMVIKNRQKDIPGVQGKAVRQPSVPDDVTMTNSHFEKMMQMLFDRIDRKIEERFVLSEKGLTNLQDQITELRRMVSETEDAVYETSKGSGASISVPENINVNIRFGIGWDK